MLHYFEMLRCSGKYMPLHAQFDSFPPRQQEEQTKHLKHYATTAEPVLIKEKSLNDVPLLVSSM